MAPKHTPFDHHLPFLHAETRRMRITLCDLLPYATLNHLKMVPLPQSSQWPWGAGVGGPGLWRLRHRSLVCAPTNIALRETCDRLLVRHEACGTLRPHSVPAPGIGVLVGAPATTAGEGAQEPQRTPAWRLAQVGVRHDLTLRAGASELLVPEESAPYCAKVVAGHSARRHCL